MSKQIACNVVERSTTLQVVDVSIGIYLRCGTEQLKTLVESL